MVRAPEPRSVVIKITQSVKQTRYDKTMGITTGSHMPRTGQNQ